LRRDLAFDHGLQLLSAKERRMAIDVEVDVELLKSEIRKTYAGVSADPLHG